MQRVDIVETPIEHMVLLHMPKHPHSFWSLQIEDPVPVEVGPLRNDRFLMLEEITGHLADIARSHPAYIVHSYSDGNGGLVPDLRLSDIAEGALDELSGPGAPESRSQSLAVRAWWQILRQESGYSLEYRGGHYPGISMSHGRLVVEGPADGTGEVAAQSMMLRRLTPRKGDIYAISTLDLNGPVAVNRAGRY
ncbi:MAG: hypothetical protein ABH879_09075 [archaeon]